MFGFDLFFAHIVANLVWISKEFLDQIHSIRFNNDERTPGQVDQFIHLRSLSISHLRSKELAGSFILETQELPNLIDLTYKPFCHESDELFARHFISGI